jgi:hypothetical protein
MCFKRQSEFGGNTSSEYFPDLKRLHLHSSVLTAILSSYIRHTNRWRCLTRRSDGGNMLPSMLKVSVNSGLSDNVSQTLIFPFPWNEHVE